MTVILRQPDETIRRVILRRPDETIRRVMPESVLESVNLRLGVSGVSIETLTACMMREQQGMYPNLTKQSPEMAAKYLLQRFPLESAKEYVRMYILCCGTPSVDYISDLIPLISNCVQTRVLDFF